MNTLKISLVGLLTLMVSACSVDHTGLLPPVEGSLYDVNCDVSFTVIDAGDELNLAISGTTRVCSQGEPDSELQIEACDAFLEMNRPNIEMDFMNISAIDSAPTGISSRISDCALAEDAEFAPGTGRVVSGLSATGSMVSTLLDPSGAILGANSFNNATASVVKSNIRVGVELAAWRYANTTATGEVRLDRINCGRDGDCDLVLRHLTLKMADFTIVRPTVFAADIHVTDAEFYLLNNYTTKVDGRGYFTFDKVETMVTGIVDGERINLKAHNSTSINGRFTEPRVHVDGDSSAHSSRYVEVNLNELADRFYVDANLTFAVNTFSTQLRNKGTNRCLRGDIKRSGDAARVYYCSSKMSHQRWSIEQSKLLSLWTPGKPQDAVHKIRLPLKNQCLNLKSKSQGYDGGQVSVVMCSSHSDQDWLLNEDHQIVHRSTGLCLNVDGKRQDREGGLVTVKHCKAMDDQQWDYTPLVTRY